MANPKPPVQSGGIKAVAMATPGITFPLFLLLIATIPAKPPKVAIITSNWITPKKLRKFNAVCTDAIISSDFITQEIVVEKDQDSETIQNEKQEPLLLEIQSFLGAIEGNNDQVVKSQEAVNVTKIAEAALLSSQKGIPIYLDLK